MDFTLDHPEHGEKTQVICAPNSVPRVVTPVGQLSQYQHNEDRVQGGHPETLAMQNDLAAILLALFCAMGNTAEAFQQLLECVR